MYRPSLPPPLPPSINLVTKRANHIHILRQVLVRDMQQIPKHVIQQKLATDDTPRPQAACSQSHKQPSRALFGQDGGDRL